MLDGRYLSHIVVGMNSRMDLLHQTKDWILMRVEEKIDHLFPALIHEVSTDMTLKDTIDWIGSSNIPEKVVESMKKLIMLIERN